MTPVSNMRFCIIVISLIFSSCVATQSMDSWPVNLENGQLKWGTICEVSGSVLVKDYQIHKDRDYSINGVAFASSVNILGMGNDFNLDSLIIQCGKEGIPIYLYRYRLGKYKRVEKLTESQKHGTFSFQISKKQNTFIVFGKPHDSVDVSHAIKTTYFLDSLDQRFSMKGMTMECE